MPVGHAVMATTTGRSAPAAAPAAGAAVAAGTAAGTAAGAGSSTDLLFALDSIPAIYGLTQDPFIVFSTNLFALRGLRQLYFLLGGLLDRLVYLPYGLSFILAFIGVKLVLHALHENTLPFINGGEHVTVPEIPIWLSLSVILVTLAVTTVLSLTVGAARAPHGAPHHPEIPHDGVAPTEDAEVMERIDDLTRYDPPSPTSSS